MVEPTYEFISRNLKDIQTEQRLQRMRFDIVEQRFSTLDARLGGIEERSGAIESRLDSIIDQLEGLRIDQSEGLRVLLQRLEERP